MDAKREHFVSMKFHLNYLWIDPVVMECQKLGNRNNFFVVPPSAIESVTKMAVFCITEQAFSKQNFESHPSITSLCDHVDLVHTCGYVTLLNTGQSSRTVFVEDPEVEDYYEEASNGITFNTHQSDTESDGPRNGVKDETSANMLATEIDLLDSDAFGASDGTVDNNVTVTILKENMTLDLDLEHERDIQMSRSLEHTKQEDWVLLECYFGIPLFSSSLNKDVCSKVISEGLFTKKR